MRNSAKWTYAIFVLEKGSRGHYSGIIGFFVLEIGTNYSQKTVFPERSLNGNGYSSSNLNIDSFMSLNDRELCDQANLNNLKNTKSFYIDGW